MGVVPSGGEKKAGRRKSEVDEWKKIDVSHMHGDLQNQVTLQELLDVMDFMITLKK